jgi:hypothetical protein
MTSDDKPPRRQRGRTDRSVMQPGRAAYNHSDHLAERAAMMQTWADWLDAVAADNPDEGNAKD